MGVTTLQDVHKDGEGWAALPLFASGPESRAPSSELLDLDEDYEMGFEAILTPSSRALSPAQNMVTSPPKSGFEQHRKVIFWKMMFCSSID